jgi:hypothetical protein
MTYDTNQKPIASLVDVISELEKSILFFLQHPEAADGLEPHERVPTIEAPALTQTDVRFFIGDVEKYSHISRPYIVWTLGDTRQAGSQARGLRHLDHDPKLPRPFKKSLDLLQCTLHGAVLDGAREGIDGGADKDAAHDRWKRGTIKGCEQLRWCYWWALREHWGGNVTFEREGWLEVLHNNQTGYAWQSSFRVPMSQMRPFQPTIPTPPLDIDLRSKRY